MFPIFGKILELIGVGHQIEQQVGLPMGEEIFVLSLLHHPAGHARPDRQIVADRNVRPLVILPIQQRGDCVACQFGHHPFRQLRRATTNFDQCRCQINQ